MVHIRWLTNVSLHNFVKYRGLEVSVVYPVKPAVALKKRYEDYRYSHSASRLCEIADENVLGRMYISLRRFLSLSRYDGNAVWL